MQATQTISEGLKREFRVVVPATELESRLATELAGLKDRVRINGFRPGKVPMPHLRKLYGRSVMADVVQNTVTETNRQIVEENKFRLALEPQIVFPEDKGEVEAVMDARADLSYTVSLEVLPSFTIADHTGIALTREVAEVSAEELDSAVERMARQNRQFAPKDDDAVAADGDRVTIDFVGLMDGVPFEGGSGDGIEVDIGSGSFIPGFEEQLVGARTGETREIKVTFPVDYTAETLAGKPADFTVTVRSVAAAGEIAVDDELAKSFGMENLEALRNALKARIQKDFDAQSRRRLKKSLLDALDGLYSFDLPPSLVGQEFENVWKQLQEDMKRANKTFADEGTTEEEARDEYRRICERRVRLGLVLAEAGEKANIKIEDDEVTQALVERARQFPGQEKVVWDYYRKNPQALAELRAPLFEEKVIDHLLTGVQVSEKVIAREALFADEDETGTAAGEGEAAEKPKRKSKQKE